MDLTEDEQEVVGFEAVNEDQWLYRLESMLFVIADFLICPKFTCPNPEQS